MTYEEFVEKLDENKIYYDEDFRPGESYNRTPAISISWTTGGLSGGSCWGDEPSARELEPKPNFDSLDDILELICPDISYIKAKKIYQILQTSEYHCSGYYGNYEVNTQEYIFLEDLYNKLVELNLIN